MARLSKTSPFQIYNDGNSTSEAVQREGFDENVKEQEKSEEPFAWTRKDDGFVTESDDEIKGLNYDGAQEGDDEKNYTRTSISSFPESSYPTDFERTPMHKPYTPSYVRPSSRRMQMSSPLRKGKFGTPYSEPRGSPRSRRKDFDDNDSHEPKRFPLILLHITALPISITWTYQAMRETLPQHVLDNLQLLKSKLSPTVLKRGILIPHPRDDYELLEEKLLEALELQEPRISKCGHYRNRHSTDSTVTTASSSTDSGIGSSVDGSDEEHCSTCHHHLRAAGSGKQKWSIRVYAANGLMRASAWSAAWSEMERVDVEIMPWIKDELRIKLDEANTQELVVAKVDHEADEVRINQLVEERLKLLEQDSERAREAEMSREIERIVINEQRQFSQAAQEASIEQIEAAKRTEHVPTSQPISTELPNIYRPKDIPLSILLCNYIFLLARKPKNMAVFLLVLFISGMLSIVGPATMSTCVTEMSTLVVSQTAHIWHSQGVVEGTAHSNPVLSISDVSSRDEYVAEVPTDATGARDLDTVTVSESAPVSFDADSVGAEEPVPEQAQPDAENLDNSPLAKSESPAEQESGGENMADAAEELHAPNMEIPSDPLSTFEETDSAGVEVIQAKHVEDQHALQQGDHVKVETEVLSALEEALSASVEGIQTERVVESQSILQQSDDFEVETEILLAPENVEIEVDSDSVATDDDGVAMSDPPQFEQVEKCLPYSISPASCSLDGNEIDNSLEASSFSGADSTDQCSPYSVFSRDQATCSLDEVDANASIAME